jgi:hypothetical protein
MLVSSFNLSQSFSYTPYLFYKKPFKSEINSFCIWTLPFMCDFGHVGWFCTSTLLKQLEIPLVVE